ncbi:MAG: PAS domain S-box protein [Deltaproteobacteria bacterium]|nr:PAS domain S-box protein [Deltaproteobacteria bacterium]
MSTIDDEIRPPIISIELLRRNIQDYTQALLTTKQEYQTLFEQAPCQISVQDKEFRLVKANRMFIERFGHRLGEHCYWVYKGRDSKCEPCSVEKTFQDGLPHFSEEVVRHRGGKTAYLLVQTAPIYDELGHVIEAMEMSTDITHVRLLEEELKRSEENYRMLFDNDPHPIFVFNRETLEILDANERALREYGYTEQELVGKSFLELADPDEWDRLRQASLAQKNVIFKVHHRTKSNQQIIVDIRFSCVRYSGLDTVIATTADVTEYLRNEQALVQAGKMATLGEMSAGIAHELNQPLSVIKTSSSFLIKKLSRCESVSPDILKTLAEEMDSQVDRASKIINQLRMFGRKTGEKKVNVQLNECIRGVFTVLGRQMEVNKVRVVLNLDENLPPVKGDLNRLEQVFLNIILNAKDAMDEKESRLKNYEYKKILTVSSYQISGKIVVSITDTGIGMDSELKEKIFQPFFTTKPIGKGTGLGLSISFGIVSDYDGSIEVDSRPDQGTTFIILFPASD